jgi:hypothetical protein
LPNLLFDADQVFVSPGPGGIQKGGGPSFGPGWS